MDDLAKLKDRARKAREKGRDDSVYADAIAAIEAPTPDAAGIVERDEKLFNDLLGNMASYGEWGSPSYREAALRTIAEYRAEAAATIAAQAAENERLREAAANQNAAIAEYYRYWTGGETRGSYDGKPERNALWASMYKARAVLATSQVRHD